MTGLAACSAGDESDAAPLTAVSSIPAATPEDSPTSAAPARRPGTRAATPAAKGAPQRTFTVAVRHLDLSRSGRELPTTVWYPKDGEGPFPLVVFSHGLTAQPSDYADLIKRWARAGFVVAAAAYPHTSHGVEDYDPLDVTNQPADASSVLTSVLALNHRAGDPLENRLDTERIGAAGHSAGGITTVGLFSSNRDDRLTAGIVMAGEQVLPAPYSGPAAAMLFVHGKLDKTVSYRDGFAAYDAVPWPKAMMSITKGGHATTKSDFGVVAATTTDFWRWSLYDDPAAKSRLNADATKGGLATLTNRL
ncbi:hypothetical protein GCM10012284_40010 [Mangrovihabitans endophyticus]|uniref:PET hydrolase/cutinase-like domain-containing protein n=2 Tax=Mangrovihabitans endophyticus TaxID=1751298 RepID=A0A8J3FPI1_9ACTN|nr:hypothetical protein GCM10012284_40010 [Mangrovihabitans endophyticus]